MLMGSAQNVIGHDPELVRHFAVAHNGAYQHCDIDLLMASTSPRGGIWAGLLPPDNFVVNETPEDVARDYVELISQFKVLPPRIFSLFATDWYTVFEVGSEMIHLESGQVFPNQAVCLFGNDELGTAVDMAWPFQPGAVRPARGQQGAARSELIDLDAQEQRIDGWRKGSVELAAQGIAEKGIFFLPVFDQADPRRAIAVTGRTGYEAWLVQLFDLYRPIEIRLVNNNIGDRHAFSETRWTVEARSNGATVAFRYALVEILDEAGLVSGMLGYATLLD